MNLEEYEELICGGIVGLGGLGLMFLMFVFGYVGNAMAAVKNTVEAHKPKVEQTYQHVAQPLGDRSTTTYQYTTAESIASRFGRPRQF